MSNKEPASLETQEGGSLSPLVEQPRRVQTERLIMDLTGFAFSLSPQFRDGTLDRIELDREFGINPKLDNVHAHGDEKSWTALRFGFAAVQSLKKTGHDCEFTLSSGVKQSMSKKDLEKHRLPLMSQLSEGERQIILDTADESEVYKFLKEEYTIDTREADFIRASQTFAIFDTSGNELFSLGTEDMEADAYTGSDVLALIPHECLEDDKERRRLEKDFRAVLGVAGNDELPQVVQWTEAAKRMQKIMKTLRTGKVKF